MFNSLSCLLFLLLFSHGTAAPFQWTGQTSVTVDEGQLVGGRFVAEDGVEITAFLGVPYAEPPVGNLRFMPPVPKTPWTGRMEAMTYPNPCVQTKFPGVFALDGVPDEDCLAVSIYVPRDVTAAVSNSTATALPVMVWIHGGGFSLGSGTPSGPHLSQLGDVIVVAINYRLSVFGFLSTNDSIAPGNLGLLDQQLAMKWVKKNIHLFGGDSNKITIFGESAGSLSVSFHIFNEESNKYFHRAIAQSGHIVQFSMQPSPLQNTRRLAQLVNCSTDDNSNMISCLQSVTAETLHKTAEQALLQFLPMEDGKFVKGSPESTIRNAVVPKIDILTGVNEFEGWFVPLFFGGITQTGLNKTDFVKLVTSRPDLLPVEGSWTSSMTEAFLCQYTPYGQESNPQAWMLALINATGDYYFVSPTVRFLNGAASKSNLTTYMYMLTESPGKIFELAKEVRPSFITTTHGDDLPYVFGDILYQDGSTEEQKKVSQDMIRMWSNFANTGNPQVSAAGLDWKPWTKKDKNYFIISHNTTENSFKKDLWPERMNFWTNEFPKVQGSTLPVNCSRSTNNPSEPFQWTGEASVRVEEGEMVGGHFTAEDGVSMTAFLGVPYAEPPTGPLRFKPPVPKRPWNGPWKAMQYPHACIQSDSGDMFGFQSTTSEDCLALSIFVPRSLPSAANSTSAPLPVMIWIHGGGFEMGTGNDYGHHLSHLGNVIVVSINYRLNVFGFLTTNDTAAPGNNAFLDQQLAIRWVKKNIQHFGGDSTTITIFGESAGASSVGFHVFSKASPQLFQRAILQSGQIADFIIQQDYVKNVQTLSQLSNCSSSDTAVLIQCLQRVDAELLLNTAASAYILFLPIVDGVFIEDLPSKMLRNGIVPKVDILTGVTEYEGWFYPVYFLGLPETGINKTQFLDLAMQPTVIPYFGTWTPAMKDALLCQYTPYGREHDGKEWFMALVNACGDSIFAAPTVQFLEGAASNSKLRAYTYVLTESPRKLFNLPPGTRPSYISSTHGDDVPFVFGDIIYEADATETEKEISHAMIKMWTNFARTGNPQVAVDGNEWKPWTPKDRNYFVIGANATKDSFKKDLWPKRMAFWNQLMPQIQDQRAEGNCTVTRDPPIEITLKQGKLIGRVRNWKDMYVREEFLGVPFAAPPVGELRFKSAQEHEGWQGRLDAFSYKHMCLSGPFPDFVLPTARTEEVIGDSKNKSEDCLYLNVYVPRSVKYARSKKLAVMVWIHGGGFFMGSAGDYEPFPFVVHSDVIVVTVPYRLAVFGFFTTGDAAARGNWALTDQQMGLRWVHENIAEFGGDPARVTIFGESAGGASVMYQVHNSQSRRYFSAAVPMSGQVYAPWGFDSAGSGIRESRKAADKLGCPKESSKDMVACFRTKVAEEINNAAWEDAVMTANPWLPRIDGEFVTEHPYVTSESGSYKDINLMVGVNNAELSGFAELFISSIILPPENKTINMTLFEPSATAFTQVMYTEPFENPELARLLIINEYFTNMTDDLMDATTRLTNLGSDMSFAASAVKAISNHVAKGGKGYFYVFSHDYQGDAPVEGFNPRVPGAVHGEDILYYFGHYHLEPEKFSNEDRRLTDNFMEMLSNFAKTGNPSYSDVTFPRYDNQKKNYLELDTTPEVRSDFIPARAALWNDIIPRTEELSQQTCPPITTATPPACRTCRTCPTPTPAPTTTPAPPCPTCRPCPTCQPCPTCPVPQTTPPAATCPTCPSCPTAATVATTAKAEACAPGRLGMEAKEVETIVWILIAACLFSFILMIGLCCYVCSKRSSASEKYEMSDM